MPISLPSSLVEFILLGPPDDRRQLQDSPILGDVWVEFGRQPSARLDLLIAPYRGQHAGEVAGAIDDGLGLGDDHDPANLAFLQGLIAARLMFSEVMRVVAPKTKWWIDKWKKEADPPTHEVMTCTPDVVKEFLTKILNSAIAWDSKQGNLGLQELPTFHRFWALTGLILWAGLTTRTADQKSIILEGARDDVEEIVQLLDDLAKVMLQHPTREPSVWTVSRNRSAMPALYRSIPAVKADAATYLFKVNCSEIGWAVIDSGIDGTHPAFLDAKGKSRVKKSFDFKNFRRIVSLSNSKDKIRGANLAKIMEDNDSLLRPLKVGDPVEDEKRLKEAHDDLKRLAVDALKRGPVHWELVEKYVEIKPGTPTQTNHGTHVAGIIGASKRGGEKVPADNSDFADGMCPDISLYDFRVLGPSIEDAEFAIIAALQFIRYLNDKDNFFTIHGANLSLSIPHDVRNFACGRTPICDECERLVASGVVVVAAAGNHGYKSFETKDGSFDSYAAFSITDPGNADSVLTVGATHRFWPHTYGVSFFSSRGPTGDGRLKPDLVAPGERIHAPVPDGQWGDLDGTSMAAPHVSGAAAMLMARYSELVGQPLRIKRILCESATDLARERSFQGHGMLDVLRAFQSI
jgi:serine protease AprX